MWEKPSVDCPFLHVPHIASYSKKASIGMYNGCDKISLQILFVYFLTLLIVFYTFELRADTFPEGTEAFQASVSPEDSQDIGHGLVEQFPTSLNPLTFSSEIFITILDNDRSFKLIVSFSWYAIFLLAQLL